MNLQDSLYNSKFSHIYVEREIQDNPRTKAILERFKDATVVTIDHYKDVFCRRRQNFTLQHNSQSLILAAKKGNNVYEGARVCQSFGNEYFYYTSCVMNCIFDCDYCYLKGMYPSGNMVIFVNLEDTFKELEQIMEKHDAYVCVSYDTDLIALEDITGFVKLWNEFVLTHPKLRIEIRTKSGRTDIFKELNKSDRMIIAYTVSPDEVALKYEHGAGSLRARVEAAKMAMEAGFTVRLCFDPMIYCPDWQKAYSGMVDYVFSQLDYKEIIDFSVGSFRISQDYMKKMRKSRPDSGVLQFPYQNVDGVYQYPIDIQKSMEMFLVEKLKGFISEDKIFMWKED